MSIEPDALLPVAVKTLDAVIAALQGTASRNDPVMLHRIGRLDAALAAAQAAAGQGHPDEAALLAAGLLRDIARDFPAHAAALPDLSAEDRLRVRLGRQALKVAA